MVIQVKIKDLDQNITHTLTGVGETRRDAIHDAYSKAKRLLGTNNLEVKQDQ